MEGMYMRITAHKNRRRFLIFARAGPKFVESGGWVSSKMRLLVALFLLFYIIYTYR